jgi:hypothetical protein
MLWSALTLCTSYKGKSCRFELLKASPFLMALATERFLDV